MIYYYTIKSEHVFSCSDCMCCWFVFGVVLMEGLIVISYDTIIIATTKSEHVLSCSDCFVVFFLCV